MLCLFGNVTSLTSWIHQAQTNIAGPRKLQYPSVHLMLATSDLEGTSGFAVLTSLARNTEELFANGSSLLVCVLE